MNKYAVIDIGTNSVLCLIAQGNSPSKKIDVLEDLAEIARLGEGLGLQGILLPQAMDRTLGILKKFQLKINAHQVPKERIQVLATAGMRRAQNASFFIERVQKELGMTIDVINGEREAFLSFLAINHGMSRHFSPGNNLLVMDIGGGSTELIQAQCSVTSPEIKHKISLHLGSVWLTESFLNREDPPTEESYQKMLVEINQHLEQSGVHWQTPMALVGIAGTVTTLAAMHQKMEPYNAAKIHGSILQDTELNNIIAQLKSMTLQQRITLPGLHPQRADVILAGAAIASCVLHKMDSKQLWVSDQGLRYGALWETLF